MLPPTNSECPPTSRGSLVGGKKGKRRIGKNMANRRHNAARGVLSCNVILPWF